MDTLIIKNQKTITEELAEHIASFNIDGDLFSENGEFSMLNDKEEIVYVNKSIFISWLNNLFNDHKSINKTSDKLEYILDRCSYCK